ncbi:MAG: 50S ribosomal protein L32 [Candidatus Woesebacteria bacterium]
MAPVPKKKHTRSRSNKRRNAPSKRAKLPTLVRCTSCKQLKKPHLACPHCGFYK